MTIKDKWKMFSMRSCFSTEMTDAECVKHFDALQEKDTADECKKYLDDVDLIPWHPVEYTLDGEFVEHIVANAKFAQEVEGDQL